jgi:hypothetical protein
MWTSEKAIAIYILIAVLIGAVVAWFVLGKTLRTRIAMKRQLQADPDIDDWLIIFGWTPKVLYVPTILASLLAALLISVGVNSRLVGGIWFGIFFINFVVEELNIDIKTLLIIIAALGALLLWLHLWRATTSFLRLFGHLGFEMSATGYLLIAIMGSVTILISWLKGLFYYAAITPNYLNLQEGPTETSEQIHREDYNTRVDTSDFLERLLGFGRIVITFKDRTRVPLSLLVWRIQTKAEMLDEVRASFATDRPERQPPAPAPPTTPPAPPPPDATTPTQPC